jgi:hypothetical protein
MTSARSGHTATLLPDCRVLIAGGDAGSIVLASAELFDPETGTFTATGSMKTARSGHTATLLPDGRVLIAGGFTIPTTMFANLVTSTETYDPHTGAFSATGSLQTGRGFPTPTLLQDGRVLLAGSATDKSAESCDSTASTFATAGTMTASRNEHAASLLPSGRVLIAGGYDDGHVQLASAELFDPVSGTFTAIASMATGRSGHTATLLQDGRVLLAGGIGADGTVASAEFYQP